MNDDDLKKMLNDGIEPATELAKLRTVKQSADRLKRYKPVVKRSYRIAAFTIVAVAIMSGLSYTVTTSTRSGAGSPDNETGLINSVQLTQYPAGIRTAIVRMIIGGAVAENIRFNQPSDFASLSDVGIGVFHPQGGSATYAMAPADVMADSQPGPWIFNMELSVPRIGTEDAELLAYLIDISQTSCQKINEELGIALPIPKLSHDQSSLYTKNMTSGYIKPQGATPALDAPELGGQPFGCFQSHDGKSYVYYHVLLER